MHPKNETVIKLKSNVVWIFLYDQKAELALLRQSKQLCMPIFQFPKPQNIELSWLFTLYGLILEICQVFFSRLQSQGLFKGHSFCKQCLHDLQFKKTRYSSPNLSKLARADISCQFKKTRYLCRHCLQNEWTLVKEFFQ